FAQIPPVGIGYDEIIINRGLTKSGVILVSEAVDAIEVAVIPKNGWPPGPLLAIFNPNRPTQRYQRELDIERAGCAVDLSRHCRSRHRRRAVMRAVGNFQSGREGGCQARELSGRASGALLHAACFG